MSKPSAPERPELTPAGPSAFRIRWELPETDPEVTACTIKVRIAGSQRYHNYDHATGRLVAKGGSTVPAPTCEVIAEGFEEGIAYEAVVAAMNGEGWGDVSAPSEATHLGELKPRERPPPPMAPKLVALGPGRLKVTWSIPEACPPVEASQVELTDVNSGMKLLVDAANGKLVPSGRTMFAAPRFETNVTGVPDSVEYVASVCCRNAEGLGDYSMPSDSAVAVDPTASGSGMELVLHDGPSLEVPVMEAISGDKMRVRWVLPEDAKSTMVKLRRVGDPNWYLCGGTAISAPACETVASGLEEGIEYEAMVAFLIQGRWCCESPVSKPACIGELKLPGLPGAPKEPTISVVREGHGHMRVRWQSFTAVPPLTGTLVKVRPLGARVWQFVNPANGQLCDEEQDCVPMPRLEVDVYGVQPGVRYEAAVAMRNRLGLGPESGLSGLACIGPPTPKLMRCTYCFTDFDLQHSEYTKGPESFWCVFCRFRQMDPFNAVIEPNGLLAYAIASRPHVAFELPLPDLKAWRKEDHSVWMRMVKVDSDHCSQAWPKKLTLEVNGNEVFTIKEPEEGHVRRDVPWNITAGLRPGVNHVTIKMEDDHLASYALALVRTQVRTAQQIASDTPVCDEETARTRVCSLLSDTWGTPLDNEDEEEISCVISNKLKLRCPLSFERVVNPVRGENCQHLQCFGLGAYLESNMKMRALNNRWTCPVCANVLKPNDLRVDAYVERVLSETPAHIDEVLIMQDGSYRCIEEILPEKAALQRQKEEEAKAAAEAAAREAADDGEVQELPTTIDDGDGADLKRKANPVLLREAPQAKRQRRRQKLMTVPDATAAATFDSDSSE